ncbi:hypothetical protein BKA57DRAFT_447727, partial [Linnemannia elongata]
RQTSEKRHLHPRLLLLLLSLLLMMMMIQELATEKHITVATCNGRQQQKDRCSCIYSRVFFLGAVSKKKYNIPVNKQTNINNNPVRKYFCPSCFFPSTSSQMSSVSS